MQDSIDQETLSMLRIFAKKSSALQYNPDYRLAFVTPNSHLAPSRAEFYLIQELGLRWSRVVQVFNLIYDLNITPTPTLDISNITFSLKLWKVK